MKGILNYLKAARMLIIVSLPALANAHPSHGDHSHSNGWVSSTILPNRNTFFVSVAIVISLYAFVFRRNQKPQRPDLCTNFPSPWASLKVPIKKPSRLVNKFSGIELVIGELSGVGSWLPLILPGNKPSKGTVLDGSN